MKDLPIPEGNEQVRPCRFGYNCLEDFESSLCCKIVAISSTCLIVTPASSFKSENCSHSHVIQHDGEDVHICTCPARLAIYEEFGT